MPDPCVDRIVFETPSVRIGAFRCPTTHPSFRDSGPIQENCFVFPRTPVIIQHADGRAFAADPTIVTLYNRGQEYRRRPVSPSGDRCDWYAVSDEVLRDAVSEFDEGAASSKHRPMRFAFTRGRAATYLRQRHLFTSVGLASPCDALYVEEAVCELLHDVLADAYADPAIAGRAADEWKTADELAQSAIELLGRRFAEPLTLCDIARAVGASLYHLCRSFRRSTGTTLHEYRNQLRLRSALDRLETAGGDLSQLALDLGYSSHSHFTASFHRAFGVTPSAARRRISARS